MNTRTKPLTDPRSARLFCAGCGWRGTIRQLRRPRPQGEALPAGPPFPGCPGCPSHTDAHLRREEEAWTAIWPEEVRRE